jgi:hypothetical protein
MTESLGQKNRYWDAPKYPDYTIDQHGTPTVPPNTCAGTGYSAGR